MRHFKLSTTIALLLSLSLCASAQLPRTPDADVVQDTFFGLKLADYLTVDQIKEAVGDKGKFDEADDIDDIDDEILVSFTNVSFAGETWEYADFWLTRDCQFYRFEVSNTYLKLTGRKKAESLYSDLKSRLEKKYGFMPERISPNSRSVSYLGGNGVFLVCSQDYESGSSFMDLRLTYYDYELMKRIIESEDDDL